ncbi:MAG: hypothetical protein ACI8QC_003767 [Planctomycetota bacterium]|jgi:hypothetical protein
MFALTTLATNDWLETMMGPGAKRMADFGFLSFLMLMAVSAAAGIFVSLLYRIFFRSRATGSEIHRAFPLIAISITAIFIAIQFSLPLSLGLLGALSIVRFRTPVKEPEEIGFLMLVVACSLCCATFNLLFLGVVLLVAVSVLLLLHWRSGLIGRPRSDGMLVLRLPGAAFASCGSELLEMVASRVTGGQLDAVAESAEETVVSYSFSSMPRERVPELQAQLRTLCADLRSDLYFSRGA